MNPIRLLTVLTSAALFVGCAADSPEPTATSPRPVLTPERVAEIRASYQQVNPDTRVGYVNALLPDSSLASVTEIPVEDIATGDVVTFIDQQQQVIANGRVVNVVEGDVHVKFEPTTRAPEEATARDFPQMRTPTFRSSPRSPGSTPR